MAKFTKEYVDKIVLSTAQKSGCVSGATISASGIAKWISSAIFEVVTSEEYRNYANTQPESKED